MAQQSDSICPIYPFADHGTYWSYYALHCPGCVEPCAYDGPPGLSSNCADPNNCTGCVQVGRYATPSDSVIAKKPYYLDGKLAQEGIDPPKDTHFHEGVHVRPVGIDYVRCYKDPHGAGEKTVVAEVFWVKVKPPASVPGGPYGEWEGGIGYQVTEYQTVDRDCTDGEVVTVKRNGHGLTIFVYLYGNLWARYDVVLLRGQADA